MLLNQNWNEIYKSFLYLSPSYLKQINNSVLAIISLIQDTVSIFVFCFLLNVSNLIEIEEIFKTKNVYKIKQRIILIEEIRLNIPKPDIILSILLSDKKEFTQNILSEHKIS